MCYVGSKEKGQEYLAAISAWDGEQCPLNEVDEKSFLHEQDSVAQVLRAKGAVVAPVFNFAPVLDEPSSSGQPMVHTLNPDQFPP
jgi:hypothetical protein